MTLEFHNLIKQINALGEYYSGQEVTYFDQIETVRELLSDFGDEDSLEYIKGLVKNAIDKELKYRGACPIDEALLDIFPPSKPPNSATIIAVDGSQISPNPHEPILYYLINTGAIVLRHGSNLTPEIETTPNLYFEDKDIKTNHGLISNDILDIRRTVAELDKVADYSEINSGSERPLISLVDGPLLYVIRQNNPEQDLERERYFQAMRRLRDVHSGLAGYVDRPRSTFITSLLNLLDIGPDRMTLNLLRTNGRLEGLNDRRIFENILAPGYRSALFNQISSMNKSFKESGGKDLEIAFFYMNVSTDEETPIIVRIEVPRWVADARDLLSDIQAIILQQCQQTGIRYPYVLARADELAVVKFEDTKQLNTMIAVALARQGLYKGQSNKQLGKNAARVKKSRY